jgi:hypothetical protein
MEVNRPLTKPLCPAPPLPILSNIGEFGALREPLYTAAGSTAAIVLIRHAAQKPRDMKVDHNILNLVEEYLCGRSESSQLW